MLYKFFSWLTKCLGAKSRVAILTHENNNLTFCWKFYNSHMKTKKKNKNWFNKKMQITGFNFFKFVTLHQKAWSNSHLFEAFKNSEPFFASSKNLKRYEIECILLKNSFLNAHDAFGLFLVVADSFCLSLWLLRSTLRLFQAKPLKSKLRKDFGW